MKKAPFNYQKIFWCFTLLQALLWILAPTIFRYALAHDTIEGAMWGMHLEWGYDKNPWMNAWLTRLGWVIGGTSGIGIYAIGQLFIITSFWSVWRLAQKFLAAPYALISVFLLEGTVNYTLVTPTFNDNLIELGLWPLLFLFFYQAIKEQRYRDWLGVGIVAGLAMMAKYYTAFPMMVMLFFLMTTREGRVSFKKSGLYLALLSFMVIITPHIIWLFQHDFITVQYALDRADDHSIPWIIKHFYYPIDFALAQLINVVAMPLLLLFSYSKHAQQKDVIAPETTLTAFDHYFLLSMAFGTYILTVFLSGIFGWHLYNEWGVPLISLWGIVIVAYTQFSLTIKAFKRFVIIIFAVMICWVATYPVGLYLQPDRRHSDNYPAQEVADIVTSAWQTRYHKPLEYVAGSRYVAGYVAFYSKDHPSVYAEWSSQFSPWINVEQMKKYGAVFVQDNYYGTTVFGNHPNTDFGKKFPASVLQKYPGLIILPVEYIPWHRSGDKIEPIPLLIGFLPPEQ